MGYTGNVAFTFSASNWEKLLSVVKSGSPNLVSEKDFYLLIDTAKINKFINGDTGLKYKIIYWHDIKWYSSDSNSVVNFMQNIGKVFAHEYIYVDEFGDFEEYYDDGDLYYKDIFLARDAADIVMSGVTLDNYERLHILKSVIKAFVLSSPKEAFEWKSKYEIKYGKNDEVDDLFSELKNYRFEE